MTYYDEIELKEEQEYDYKLVKDVLGLDAEAYNRFKWCAVKGLIGLGNRFERALGITLRRADVQNSVRIMSIWRKECAEFELLYRINEAKRRAEEDSSAGS